MSNTIFDRPDLSVFTRLDGLGLEVTGQRVEPGQQCWRLFQDTPRAWATRATVRWWTTRPVSAQRTAARESFARGSAAWLMS